MVAVRGTFVITANVERQYLSRFGPPTESVSVPVSGVTIEVLKWDPLQTDQGVVLYATLGAAALPVSGSARSLHRLELMLGLSSPRDSVAKALATLARYPSESGQPLEHGHTLDVVSPLWDSTEMTAFLVTRPLEALVPTLEVDEGLAVEFMTAIPIFQSEIRYKQRHGVEALLTRWELFWIEFWDPDRSPAPV